MKKALIAGAVLVVLLGAAAFWAYHSLDVIVRVTLEHFGPDVLGASVKVADVHLSAKDGQGTLKGLEIGNPAGFSAAKAARFGEIRLSIDPQTITEPVVLVREIRVEAPQITYERGKNATNLDTIQKNIETYVRQAGGAADDKAGAGETRAVRRFVVERLSIRGAKVTMTNPALKGQGLTFDLPDIELRDIGRRENGLRASQVANVVANAIIAKIAQRVLTNIDLLRKGGVEGAVDALKGLIK